MNPKQAIEAEALEKAGPTGSGFRALFRQHRSAFIGSLVFAGGLAWLLHRGALPVLPAPEAHARMPWWTVLAYAAAFLGVLLVRATRWYFLLAAVHRVPMRRVLEVSFLFYGAVLLLPFRLGEAVRPALIRSRGQLSAWAATGTVASERVVDGLVSATLLFAALQLADPLEPLPDRIGALPVPAAVVPRAAYLMLVVFGAAFATMGLFYWRRAWARALTERVVGLVSPKLGHWLANKVDQLADGLRFLPQFRYSGPFLGITLTYWCLNVLSVWMLMRLCGLHGATLAQAASVIGVLAVGLLVPAAPGFFGTFQISCYAGLAMYYPPEQVVGAGSVMVFWMYGIQVLISLLGAAVALVTEYRRPEATPAPI